MHNAVSLTGVRYPTRSALEVGKGTQKIAVEVVKTEISHSRFRHVRSPNVRSNPEASAVYKTTLARQLIPRLSPGHRMQRAPFLEGTLEQKRRMRG